MEGEGWEIVECAFFKGFQYLLVKAVFFMRAGRVG